MLKTINRLVCTWLGYNVKGLRRLIQLVKHNRGTDSEWAWAEAASEGAWGGVTDTDTDTPAMPRPRSH